MENKSDEFFDEWDHEIIEELFVLTASASKPSSNPTISSEDHRFLPPKPKPYSQALQSISYRPPQPLPSAAISSVASAASFSPPRELSQRTTSVIVDLPSNLLSDKDLEIERLKRELEHATKHIANLEKERVNLKKERDKKEDKSRFTSSGNEEESACAKYSKTKSINEDIGTLAPNRHNIVSKFQNGVSSNDPIVETTFKDKGVELDIVSNQEAQGVPSDDLSAYLDLSQKLLAIWGSPTKKMGNNVISKLLAGCRRDFHILFGCMNMNLPSQITRGLFSDLSSSGVALPDLKDRFHTPEAAKMSNLYLALTKIADGTDVLETLIGPLLDLCGMENVVIVHSSLCVLHMLLKLLLELENNVGRSALCSGTMLSSKDFALGRTLWILV